MKRTLISLCLGMMLTLSLAGCSRDQAPNVTPTPTPDSSHTADGGLDNGSYNAGDNGSVAGNDAGINNGTGTVGNNTTGAVDDRTGTAGNGVGTDGAVADGSLGQTARDGLDAAGDAVRDAVDDAGQATRDIAGDLRDMMR